MLKVEFNGVHSKVPGEFVGARVGARETFLLHGTFNPVDADAVVGEAVKTASILPDTGR